MFLEDSEDVILFSVFGAVIGTLAILVVMIVAVIVYWRQKAQCHAHGVWPQVQSKATSLTDPQYVWFYTNTSSTDIVYKLDYIYISFISCRHYVIEGAVTGEFLHGCEINVCDCLQK